MELNYQTNLKNLFIAVQVRCRFDNLRLMKNIKCQQYQFFTSNSSICNMLIFLLLHSVGVRISDLLIILKIIAIHYS